MFGKKKWRNVVLIEGEKEAMLVSRTEGLPGIDHAFNRYPVDFEIAQPQSFRKALRKAIFYSKAGLYNLFYKEEKK